MSADFKPTLDGYKDLKPFVFWAQTTLPTVFDDSLSYYEVLTKLTKMVNVLLENTDTAEHNIETLATVFNQLQDYVNHYFDSLDVSAEVDAKLDAMVEDGTLDAIIQPIVEHYTSEVIDDVVNEQLSAVVSEQIGPAVANQIDAAIAPQITPKVNAYLDANLPQMVADEVPVAVGEQIDPAVTTLLPSVVNEQLPMAVSTEMPTALPPVVQSQLPGVVATQIPGAVSSQMPAVLAPIATQQINTLVPNWLATHIHNPSSPPLDDTLGLKNCAAESWYVGRRFFDLQGSPATMEEDKKVVYQTGEVVEAEHWLTFTATVSDKFPCSVGYPHFDLTQDPVVDWTYAYYDANGDYIANSGSTWQGFINWAVVTDPVPEGAAVIKFSIQSDATDFIPGDLAVLVFGNGAQIIDAINAAIENVDVHVAIDDTLTESGKAADAKVTGDEINELRDIIDDISEYKLTQLATTITTAKYIYYNGAIMDAASGGANWKVTDYVDVSDCEKVAITASSYTNRLYYAFYDENQTYISGSGKAYISGVSLTDELVDVPATAKYCVAMTYLAGANDPVIKKAEIVVKLLDGSVTTDKLQNESVTEDKIVPGLFIKAVPSKNLFNIDTAESSAILANQSNQTVASNQYDTSDFIPVKANTKYTISPYCRIYCLSTGKTAGTVTVYNNDYVSTPRTITVASDGFLRFSYVKGMQYIQVEEGETVTSYAPFGSSVETGIGMNTKMKQEAGEVASNVMFSGDAVSVKKANNQLTIVSQLDGKELKRIFLINKGDGNDCANFYDDYLDGSQIKEARDDIAPQRLKIKRDGETADWTVGANHGWPCFTISGSPLSSVDVGAIWSNGTNQFVVFSVDSNGTAVFLYPCTVDVDKLAFTTTSVSGTFEHVSGGAYTTSFEVSNPSVMQNLYPSVNNKTVKVMIDGATITENGDYSGKACKIVETYSIIDYSDLITKIVAQGTSFDINTVDAFATITNCYEFLSHVCNITQTIKAAHALTIGNSGVIQATTIYNNGGAVYCYCNHVASGALASSGLVNMASYSTSNYATSSNAETGKVPNRFVQINKLNNVNRYAFIMGFYPDKSSGKDTTRAALSTFMELRSTKKMYPYCIVNKSLAEGESVTVAAFKAYQGASDLVSNCMVGDYVVADAQATGSFTIEANRPGAEIDIVDQSGVTLQSDIVDGVGVNAVASGAAQSVTFKMK